MVAVSGTKKKRDSNVKTAGVGGMLSSKTRGPRSSLPYPIRSLPLKPWPRNCFNISLKVYINLAVVDTFGQLGK